MSSHRVCNSLRLTPTWTSIIASVVVTLLLVTLSLRGSNACLTPAKGCVRCDNLVMGYDLTGLKNASGNVNFEKFKDVGGTIIANGSVNVAGYPECCKACAAATGCYYWHFYPTRVTSGAPTVANESAPGNPNCYLLANRNTVSALSASTKNYNASYIGGKCNGKAGVWADPHFVGAEGTRFDFNGEIGKPFCLFTDRRFHVNMLLDGYMDDRAPTANGPTVRSWIRALTFLWRDEEGVEHSAYMKAREGTSAERDGSTFISVVTIDGEDQPPPYQIGSSLTSAGGFTLTLSEQTSRGPQDMDVYHLTIGDLLDVEMTMRAAHALLQTKDNAFVHFGVRVLDMKASQDIHGVLGQTYRSDTSRSLRAMEYQLLAGLLRAPLHVDRKEGEGYLDGAAADYMSSSPLAADCKFATAWKEAGVAA